MYNKWNPYSEEVNNMPPIYWTLAFNFLQTKAASDWDRFILPHAEMIGQLTHPEIYKEYRKLVNKKKKEDSLPKGQDDYKDTVEGISGSGSANAVYDPSVGLVDENGRVIISKEKYEQLTGIAGVAVSY